MTYLRFTNAQSSQLVTLRERFGLSPTQARVATMLADRLTNKEIANELRIRQSTARRHTEAVLLRMGVNSRFKVVTRLAEVFAEGAA